MFSFPRAGRVSVFQPQAPEPVSSAGLPSVPELSTANRAHAQSASGITPRWQQEQGSGQAAV